MSFKIYWERKRERGRKKHLKVLRRSSKITSAFHSPRFSHIIYAEEWNKNDGRRIEDAKRWKNIQSLLFLAFILCIMNENLQFLTMSLIYFPWKSLDVRLLNVMRRDMVELWLVDWNFFLNSLLRLCLDEIESENTKQKGKECWLKRSRKNTKKMWQKNYHTHSVRIRSLAPLISIIPFSSSVSFWKPMTSLNFFYQSFFWSILGAFLRRYFF